MVGCAARSAAHATSLPVKLTSTRGATTYVECIDCGQSWTENCRLTSYQLDEPTFSAPEVLVLAAMGRIPQ